MKIKAVVFDFGGVMTTLTMPERVKALAAEKGIDWDAIVRGFAAHRLRFDSGELAPAEFYGRVWDDTDGILGGMAVGLYGIRSMDSSNANDATVWSNQYTALLPDEDAENSFAGFYVNYYAGSTAAENISTNKTGMVYHYIAWR